MNPTPPKREHKSDEGAIIPKSALEIAKHAVEEMQIQYDDSDLMDKDIQYLTELLTAYADAKVKEAMAPGYLDWSGRIRNEALEEAAHLVGTAKGLISVSLLTDMILALKSDSKSPGGSK